MRCHPRHNGRHTERHGKVDEDGVGRESLDVAPEFAGHDHRCRGRGTDEAKHRRFDHGRRNKRRKGTQQRGRRHKRTTLHHKMHRVPTTRHEMVGIDFAKGHEEHGKDEQWLHRLHHAHRRGQAAFAKRQRHPSKIGRGAQHDGDGKHPGAKKSFHRVGKEK